MTKRNFIKLVVVSVAALGLLGASPKDYPLRPVQLIVPFAAGGGTDVGTRIVVKAAEKYFPKPMIVQNIDGGGSEVGVSQMVRSKPDGYTIAGFNSASVILTTMRKASYNPLTDINPICLVVSDPRLFAVRADDSALQKRPGFHQICQRQPRKADHRNFRCRHLRPLCLFSS